MAPAPMTTILSPCVGLSHAGSYGMRRDDVLPIARGWRIEECSSKVSTRPWSPRSATRRVDLDTLTRVIDFVLDGGARGLVPCGTTGEYYA